MRIITGSARGVQLKTPKGLDVRPTADRVKESVFNILANRFWDTEVLDLFAGTGNLGLEALSRGARQAVFVDSSPVSLGLVKENICRTKMSERSELVRQDAPAAVERLFRSGRRFHLVFCDPPYNKGLVAATLKALDSFPLFHDDALVVMEHSKHEDIPEDLKSLAVQRSERYGETRISFLKFVADAGGL